ncbi:MAG: Gfo/Idh/MocA family oxidoreductase [Trueperaceae bacterium]
MPSRWTRSWTTPEIEAVINLTVPSVHAEVSRRIVEAGKHVYSEKPLATRREDGRALLDQAAERGVRIGCAPDTFLGAGLQTSRKLLDDGWSAARWPRRRS